MSIDRRLLLLGLAGAGGALVSGCGGGEYGSRMPRPMTSGDDRVRPVGPAAAAGDQRSAGPGEAQKQQAAVDGHGGSFPESVI